MFQGTMSQDTTFNGIRGNLTYIRKKAKKGSRSFIALVHLIISPSAQNFPNYSGNFYMDQLAFSSQQLSEAGIISHFTRGEAEAQRG